MTSTPLPSFAEVSRGFPGPDRAGVGPVHGARSRLPARALRGDPPQPVGTGQAVAPAAGVNGRRGVRLSGAGGDAGGLCGGDGPHVFADSRRSAGHGRRRHAAGSAELSRGVWRSDGDSGGRCLLARALEILARDIRPPHVAAACCAALAHAAGPTALVGGQVDDIQAELQGGDVTRLESIHGRKTGAMITSRSAWAHWWPGRPPNNWPPWTRMESGWAGVSDRRRPARSGRRRGVDGKAIGKGFRTRQADVSGGVGGARKAGERASALVAEACAALRTLPGTSSGLGSVGPLRDSTKSVEAMHQLLSNIESAESLRNMSFAELKQLADEIRDVLVQPAQHPVGPLRLEPGCRRTVPGPAQRLRLPPRSADLGHRASDLSAQAGHRPVSRVQHDSHQGGPDGLPQSRREPLRPVHDGARRVAASRRCWACTCGDDLSGSPRPPCGGGDRRRRVPVGHRVRGHEQRRRAEAEDADDPQRQQDVDLSARRRAGQLPRSPADEPRLHGTEDGSRPGPEQGAAVRRSGRTVPRPDQGGDQGRVARRHAVRGSRLPLHRADRRAQHRPAAQVPADGQEAGWSGPAARGHREGARLSAGGRGSRLTSTRRRSLWRKHGKAIPKPAAIDAGPTRDDARRDPASRCATIRGSRS